MSIPSFTLESPEIHLNSRFHKVLGELVCVFNVPWRLVVGHKEGYYSVFVKCEECEHLEYSKTCGTFQADLEFSLEKNGKIVKTKKLRVSKGALTDEGHGFAKFYYLKGYNHLDVLLFRCSVSILTLKGAILKTFRSFEDKDGISDLEIMVSNSKFYVQKQMLASQSPVFHTMFYGPYLESDKDSVTISDVAPDAFHDFLRALHFEPVINPGNVGTILCLADRFLARSVRRDCEEYLMIHPEINSEIRESLGEMYGLDQLEISKCVTNSIWTFEMFNGKYIINYNTTEYLETPRIGKVHFLHVLISVILFCLVYQVCYLIFLCYIAFSGQLQ